MEICPKLCGDCVSPQNLCTRKLCDFTAIMQCCLRNNMKFRQNVFANDWFGNSCPEIFLRKDFLKICRKFTGEHPCRRAISIKLISNFIEIALRHGCSPENLLHILRTPLEDCFCWMVYVSFDIIEKVNILREILLLREKADKDNNIVLISIWCFKKDKRVKVISTNKEY